MDLGIWEIIIIVGIIVLFFGAKKIPELAKGIGEGITEFKDATKKQVGEGKNEKANEPVENSTSEQSEPKPEQETTKKE